MTTIDREFATYTVTEHPKHLEVEAVFKNDSTVIYPTFHIADTFDEVRKWINHKEKVSKVVKVLNSYTTEMEGYSYFGSNPGLPENEYEDVAEDIIKLFDI